MSIIMNRRIKSIVLMMVAFLVLVSSIGCTKEENKESTPSASESNSTVASIDIQKILSGTVALVSVDDIQEQSEKDQHGETNNTVTKKVTVSIVDISKVYHYFAANGNAQKANAATIEQFINENKDNPEFQTEYIIYAEVFEENGAWKLVTAESLQEVYNKQAEALILERINEMGEIEIVDVSFEQEGGSE